MQLKARRYKIPPWPPRQVMIMKHDGFWFVDFKTCGDAEIMHQMKRLCLRLKTEYKMKYVGYSFHVVFTGHLPLTFPSMPLPYLKIVRLIIISYYRLCPDTFMTLLLYFNKTGAKARLDILLPGALSAISFTHVWWQIIHWILDRPEILYFSTPGCL